MAAPVVAGAAALMLQACPGLAPDTIKARLMISADKWGFPNGQYDPLSYGAGYLNVMAALNCTAVANQPALSPSLLHNDTGNVYLNQIIWGEQIIWGTTINDLSIIWGSQVIWGSNSLWNTNISWGTQGSQIIWGSNAANLSGPGDNINATSIYGED
jgi:serine protease AprX